MDKNDYVEWLIRDWNYPENGAELLYQKFLTSKPEIKTRIIDLFNNGECNSIEVKGFSSDSLMKTHNMNIIAALFTIDWLLREPDKAEKSILKGYDFFNK